MAAAEDLLARLPQAGSEWEGRDALKACPYQAKMLPRPFAAQGKRAALQNKKSRRDALRRLSASRRYEKKRARRLCGNALTVEDVNRPNILALLLFGGIEVCVEKSA